MLPHLVLPLLLVLPAVPALAQARPAAAERLSAAFAPRYQGAERETETARETRTVQLGASGQLDVQNVAGDIVVSRGSGTAATIEIVKTARARTAAEAREMLGLVNVVVNERAGRAEVRADYPQGQGRDRRRNTSVTVAFTITAPAGTSVTAKSVSGNVSVKDLSGEVAIESVSGDVTIENASRVAAAKTVSGDVRITNAMLDSGLEASSVSGDVVLNRARATRLTLATVSGTVSAQDVDCPRVELQAVSGDVDYSGRLARGGRYELTSHSGNIRLSPAGDTGFELTANSFSGSVRSDLPLKTQSGDDQPGGRRRTVRGVFGDGSAVLDLTSFSGNIVISKP
jgi:DUF4097 and DUF4098 domain-containing protein YvlB